jgi:hypothetical protein
LDTIPTTGSISARCNRNDSGSLSNMVKLEKP